MPARAYSNWVRGCRPSKGRCADSPPPCGEGLGVGGTATFDVLQSPPPCPSPTRGEGTPILIDEDNIEGRSPRDASGVRAALHGDRLPAAQAARRQYRRIDTRHRPAAREDQRQLLADAALAPGIEARGGRGIVRGEDDMRHL